MADWDGVTSSEYVCWFCLVEFFTSYECDAHVRETHMADLVRRVHAACTARAAAQPFAANSSAALAYKCQQMEWRRITWDYYRLHRGIYPLS